MINKRLLIKNLLSHSDENTFFDKKLKLTLTSREGKAKFLKHICALSNSNSENNSYIVIGIEETANKIIGVDFFDDSKIQNLINAYLLNPPKVQYENVAFPGLQKHKVVGLVTIEPNNLLTSFIKGAWKYRRGAGLDTARSVLELDIEDLIKRTDLEEETVREVVRILKSEFED